MWRLLSILSCGLLKVSGEYILVKDVGEWTEANTNCTLARPDIIWSGQESTVALSLDILNNTDKAWIGYTASYDIFQYIGCVLVQDIINSTVNYTPIETLHGPGHCYLTCRNSTLFGLRTSTDGPDCFCLENSIGDIDKRRKDCNVRCNKDSFVCGNTDFLSLYAKVQINENNTDGEKCLRFKAKDKTYEWKKCAENNHALCFTDGNNTSHALMGPKMGWKEAMDFCFQNNQFPINEEHYNQSLNDQDYWTAYVNALTIFYGESTSKINRFSYIKRKDDTLELKFTKNEDETTTALCQIATSTSTNTTTVTTFTTGATTTVTSVTTEHTTPYETSTSTVSSTTLDDTTTSQVSGLTHTNQPVNKSEETNQHPESDVHVSGDSKAGIYISIPLVILVCVCFAIVLLIWYRKRQGRKKADLTLSTRSNHCYDGSNYDELDYVKMTEEKDDKQTNKLQESGDASKIPNTLADMHYESLDGDVHAAGIYDFAQDINDDTINKNTAEPSYFVFKKDERPPEVSSNNKMTTPESIRDHTDTVYNTANYNLNVYNTANYNTDTDNYDHVEKKKLNTVDDGHYDTTFSSEKSEPYYDTTNQSTTENGEQNGTYDSTNYTDS